jgi:hypothetical protein
MPDTEWIAEIGRFGGISNDELTAAWTSGPQPTIFIATRSDRNAAFGTPVTVAQDAGSIADDRVALDPSGSALFAVSADRTSFVAFSLSSSGGTPTSTGEFAQIAAMARDTGGQFSEPVLGADGQSFYYVLTPGDLLGDAGPAPIPYLYESTWLPTEQVWAAGVAFTATELVGTDSTHRRRATGASADARTLFFFDEVAGLERAAWRTSPASPFSLFEDLSGFIAAAPDVRCDKLYFTQAPDGGLPGEYTAE